MVEKIHLSFHDEIRRNKIKSFLLVCVVVLTLIILGVIVSLFFEPGFFFLIMIISIIFSLGYTMVSYYNADKIALASVHATPANSNEHRMLMHSVESMSISSGLPMPKVYVMKSDQINAFASGRDPQHAVLCVTTGSINKLNKQELEGVVAHEMSHVANYDIRFMTLTAVLVGMISILAELFLRSLWLGGSDDDRGKSGVVIIVLGLLFAILAPIVAQLVSLAISRKREFAADATGVKLTRYPPGLANALKKIQHESVSQSDTKKYAKAMAPLFISDPFKNKISGLFSTHPPIEERIRKLEAM
jgi:heat shock protein HtpX